MDIKDNEKDLVIKDFEFDGIKELDNPPPPWIMWLFYVTIFFSALYMAHYHVLKQGKLQDDEYAAKIEKFKGLKKQVALDENKITLFSDAENLEAGKKLFAEATCIACHGLEGQGNPVGPNLADNYWLHGATPEQVFKVIKYGVPEKGMTAYKDQISDLKVLQLTSYVLVKIKGSNPPNPKDPQGEKIE